MKILSDLSTTEEEARRGVRVALQMLQPENKGAYSSGYCCFHERVDYLLDMVVVWDEWNYGTSLALMLLLLSDGDQLWKCLLSVVLLCSQMHGELCKHFLHYTLPVRGPFQQRTVWFSCRPALTESALSRPKAGPTRMTWCLFSNAGSSRHHVGFLSTQDDFQASSERAWSKSPQQEDKQAL